MFEDVKALILCGGLGTRLRPLTYVLPKPLLPLGTKPILELQIRFLHQNNLSHIVLATGYMREMIWKYFTTADLENFDVSLEYIIEKKALGTGGGIKNAKDTLDSTFLVLNGDILLDSLDVSELIHFHKHHDGIGTILLRKVRDPSRYGVVQLTENNKIADFIEKPKGMENEFINAGWYVFEPEVFKYIPEGKASIEKDVFPNLANEGKLYGYSFDGYWKDIGVLEDYMNAQQDFYEGKFNYLEL